MVQTFSPTKICFFHCLPFESQIHIKPLKNQKESAFPKSSKAAVNYTKTDPPWVIILRQKDWEPRGV